jgi:hypothetical protein
VAFLLAVELTMLVIAWKVWKPRTGEIADFGLPIAD